MYIRSSIFTGCYIIIIGLLSGCLQKTKQEKNDNISPLNEAIWVGGIDGGVWITIDSCLNNDKVILTVYDEDIKSKGIYELCSHCNHIDIIDCRYRFDSFDGDFIYLFEVVNDKQCFLKKIK